MFVRKGYWWKLEAVVHRCSVKKASNFIKKEIPAQVFSLEFCEISKNTFLYRTPLVAASGKYRLWLILYRFIA